MKSYKKTLGSRKTTMGCGWCTFVCPCNHSTGASSVMVDEVQFQSRTLLSCLWWMTTAFTCAAQRGRWRLAHSYDKTAKIRSHATSLAGRAAEQRWGPRQEWQLAVPLCLKALAAPNCQSAMAHGARGSQNPLTDRMTLSLSGNMGILIFPV